MQGLVGCAADELQVFAKIYYVEAQSQCKALLNDCLLYDAPTDIPDYLDNYNNTVVMCF